MRTSSHQGSTSGWLLLHYTTPLAQHTTVLKLTTTGTKRLLRSSSTGTTCLHRCAFPCPALHIPLQASHVARNQFQKKGNLLLSVSVGQHVQGLIIMNMAPDFAGAKNNKTYYQTELKEGAGFWTTCSEEGQVDFEGYVFCR